MKFNRYLDNLFNYFEANEFENDGEWDRSTNLVFSFSDWMKKITSEDLMEISGLTNKRKINELKKAAEKGVDLWLSGVTLIGG